MCEEGEECDTLGYFTLGRCDDKLLYFTLLYFTLLYFMQPHG